ncbi:MAG: hypothetical protein AB7L92_04475 [Alphaproteobacteria bacterium]
MTKATIDNLAIIDIPNAGQVEVDSWTWRDRYCFPAEQCSRQLLITTQDALQHVPESLTSHASHTLERGIDREVKILTGDDAYRHLLMVACGMKDEQFGEKQTITEIRNNWNMYTGQAEGPRKISPAKKALIKETYGGIMNMLFADVKAVRSIVFEGPETKTLKPVSDVPAVGAKALASVGSEDPVMFLASTEQFTVKNIVALDSRKRRVIIAHPDAEQLARIHERVDELKAQSKLHGTYEFITWSDARERFHQVKAVFDSVPVGAFARDREMLERWRNDTTLPPLVHLRGDPSLKEETSELWKNCGLPHVFNIEDVRAQTERDKEHNRNTTTEHACHVIENCLASRKAGKNPMRQKLNLPVNEYAQFVANASGPRRGIDHAQRDDEEKRQRG